MAGRQLALLASRVRIEERNIIEALSRRSVPCKQIDMRQWHSLADPVPPFAMALNREISYTRASCAASALAAVGVTMINKAKATELCGDKWKMSMALQTSGVPAPRTALALTPTAALAALDELGYPAVVKPLVGSGGRLVTLLPDRQTAEAVLEHVAALPSPSSRVVYVQRFAGAMAGDIRVIVVGAEAIGAVRRHGDGWRSNVTRGARTERCELTDEMAKLAVQAAEAVGAELAGVDLIEDPDEGLIVLEVNDRMEFGGFQSAFGGGLDVAERIVDYVVHRLAT